MPLQTGLRRRKNISSYFKQFEVSAVYIGGALLSVHTIRFSSRSHFRGVQLFSIIQGTIVYIIPQILTMSDKV